MVNAVTPTALRFAPSLLVSDAEIQALLDKKAEKLVEGDKDIVSFTTYVGQGSPRAPSSSFTRGVM